MNRETPHDRVQLAAANLQERERENEEKRQRIRSQREKLEATERMTGESSHNVAGTGASVPGMHPGLVGQSHAGSPQGGSVGGYGGVPGERQANGGEAASQSSHTGGGRGSRSATEQDHLGGRGIQHLAGGESGPQQMGRGSNASGSGLTSLSPGTLSGHEGERGRDASQQAPIQGEEEMRRAWQAQQAMERGSGPQAFASFNPNDPHNSVVGQMAMGQGLDPNNPQVLLASGAI